MKRIIPEYELAGVSREEVLQAIKANKWYTSELGFMEIKPWITQRFADPEVPKKWLRERRPDILLLADHFVEKYATRHRKDVRRISTPAGGRPTVPSP